MIRRSTSDVPTIVAVQIMMEKVTKAMGSRTRSEQFKRRYGVTPQQALETATDALGNEIKHGRS